MWRQMIVELAMVRFDLSDINDEVILVSNVEGLAKKLGMLKEYLVEPTDLDFLIKVYNYEKNYISKRKNFKDLYFHKNGTFTNLMEYVEFYETNELWMKIK